MTEHAAAVEDLPTIHSDPFDRMLIAQAQVEPLKLVTGDALLAKYGKSVIALQAIKQRARATVRCESNPHSVARTGL